MNYQFVTQFIKKTWLIMIITLIIAFTVGFVVTTIIQKDLYRSSTDVSYYDISYNLANNINIDFYYLFFAYYNHNHDFLTALSVDYFLDNEVLSETYDEVLRQGYDISYENFRNGINTYMRATDLRRRVTVIYPNREISILVNKLLMKYMPITFNKVINNRILLEIEQREIQKDQLAIDIESVLVENQKLLVQKNKETSLEVLNQLEAKHILLQDELIALRKTNQTNTYFINELKGITSYPFIEQFTKNSTVSEEGVLLSQNNFMVAIAFALIVFIIWIFIAYYKYIKEMIGEIHE